MMSPPRETPPVLRPMTVARRRRNQRARTAPVLVVDAPLRAMEDTRPNMKTRNSRWKVKLSRAVEMPRMTRLMLITLRPPRMSSTWPMKGWERGRR